MAEFAISLPALLLLVFAVAQLCLIGLAAFLSHYAAHCAARTYAVYIQQGSDVAEATARRAAQAALAYCHPSPDFDLDFIAPFDQEGSSMPTDAAKQIVQVQLTAHYPLLMPWVKSLFTFPFFGQASLDLHAQVCIQTEDTKEFLRQHPEVLGNGTI